MALATGQLLAQKGTSGGEWRSYAGDAGATKYSPLTQIDAANFSTLKSKLVNKILYAFRWDDTGGKWTVAWYKEMPNQAILLERFAELPYVMGETVQRAEEQAAKMNKAGT